MRTVLSLLFAIAIFAPAIHAHEIQAPSEVVAQPDGTFEFEFTYVGPSEPFEVGSLHWGPVDNVTGGDSWVDGFCMPSEGGWVYTDVFYGQLADLDEPGTTVIDVQHCSGGYGYIEHITTVLPSVVSVPDVASRIVLTAAPNPMRAGVVFEHDPDLEGSALMVFDAAGRRTVALTLGAGRTSWDGHTADGSRVAPGVYFYKLDRPGAPAQRLVVMAR